MSMTNHDYMYTEISVFTRVFNIFIYAGFGLGFI